MTESTALKMTNGFRLQWEPAQDAHVLLYPEGMVKLNPAAAEILSLVDGDRNIEEITEALQAKFPDADLSGDVKEFVSIATANGWLS
ncbi:MAG: pyrroloquinoline quinone biosynthesis peptide chaperone PqqD [Acidiferrobacterales bacterium]|nr:pyrroloquinoline quinone biosynthesis peptide chaperone PqqD [Acidiferrobacterales bacterium]